MSVRVVFAKQSVFHAPIGVVTAWEERGSCLNIFRTINHDRILETFRNYDAKDLLRSRHGMEERGSCFNIFRMTNRGRNSETFTNCDAKDLLRKTTNRCRILENFTNYEAKDLLRK
ncbi:uncharacterized protein G2W53_010300 [Senna tora]|uniref:Uncharacterized protein n=1 Tax=Senna tora TaxID=362788 RepID=A0A835CB68_9FABA|nr:uncharacterized protein G2W53_010300 [Senna tora]